MRSGIQTAILIVLLLFPLHDGGLNAADWAGEPNRFFHDFVGLNDDQINAIRRGNAVGKVLDLPTPDEVFVFGAVYLNGQRPTQRNR